MKVNILYFLFAAALGGAWYIVKDLHRQSGTSYFGTAETDGQVLNLDYTVTLESVRVTPGQRVSKGDTLVTFYRSELDRKTSEYESEIYQIKTERSSKSENIAKQREVIELEAQKDMESLKTKISTLEKEIEAENRVREAIGFTGKNATNTVKEQEIQGYRAEMNRIKEEADGQIRQLLLESRSETKIGDAEVLKQKKALGFIEKEKTVRCLLAPMDGYVERISGSKGESINGQREIAKINPSLPSMVIGFMPETMDAPIKLGDTLFLRSVPRPEMKEVGILTGNGSKMVELPLRLRKFPEIKAYGREVYIKLPGETKFYINEKILISTLPPVK